MWINKTETSEGLTPLILEACILLRVPSAGSYSFVPVYDLLGGHIIASALLARFGQADFESWIKETHAVELLAGDYDVRHPLAEDVLWSLGGQIPRRFPTRQLWQLTDEPIRARALRFAARLEPKYPRVALSQIRVSGPKSSAVGL